MADTQLIARQLLSDLKRDFGLTNEQAAGVVGNLMHESGGFGSLQEINPSVPGSAGGFGYAQWTGPRRDKFEAYVADQGLDPASYEANYGYLKHELANDPYERRQFNTVKKANTAAEAARLVSENYLRPGTPNNAARVRYAEQVLPYANAPIPPGELPEVATALATVPTPRNAPAPVTPSIDMAQMRRISAPSQLIPDTFAGLNKPQRNLGDEIGMSPIPGGQQQAPMFDAGFDTRTNAMRLFSNGPADTQGVFTGASKAPAPIPPLPSPQLAGRRATDPALQAALNAKYPAQLPPMGPATRSVPTTTIRPSASDMVRGNPMQTMEQATTIASIPTVSRPNVSASDLARGRSGISTIASYPTTGFPTTEQIVAGTGFRPPPAIPDRLMAGEPGLPALYGGNVAGVGTNGVAPMPFTRPQTQFAAAPKVAPTPFQRPTGVGTQLAVQPMPPMPIARPMLGMGGGERPAPMPAAMSPLLAMQRSIPAMFTPRPPTSPAAQRVWMTGFSDSGSSGGAHGGSDNDKNRGENQWSKGRS